MFLPARRGRKYVCFKQQQTAVTFYNSLIIFCHHYEKRFCHRPQAYPQQNHCYAFHARYYARQHLYFNGHHQRVWAGAGALSVVVR